MAIESRLAKGYWGRKLVLSVLFIAFGCWSLWDVLYKYPRQNDAADLWETRASLQEKQSQGRLTTDEQLKLDELNTRFAETMSPPTRVASLDITINKLVAAGAFPAAGLFLLTWWLAARKRYTYQDDGTLVTPEGTFTAKDITGIDLTRWKAKSLARVEVGAGQGVTLDAWIYDGVEDMIRALDARFHPEESAAPDATDSGSSKADEASESATANSGTASEKTSEPETSSDSDEINQDRAATGDDVDQTKPS